MTSSLAYLLPCSKCGAATGEPCRRLDNGAPTSEPHEKRTPLAPCGSYGGYQRHVKAGEPSCDACRDANRRYTAERRNNRPDEREKDIRLLAARRRATKRLVEAHKQEFRRLLAEEAQR